ncbi:MULTISPECIES: glycosyltransferase family 87 protein [Arthrobacter]|uniref:DUF2029 domain-containing protein n=1 Tax=Arthrobacter oryzae TaxID=409290 RepID=A0A3N0C569_9MICC|nr:MULTISPECIES: glycosyltransferase family 87 protein [Arthrobacter]QYF90767.1 DUF2029 domain-containing protein [Arthrobacter sp. PAMC25284]RNL57559.1 DUF2029 domain-containing protein [Arthrobacter oryzae]
MTKYADPFADMTWFASKYPSAAKLALFLFWGLALFTAGRTVGAVLENDIFGQDTHAYWLAAQSELTYERAPGQRDAYLYSPIFLTVIRPFALLPWPLFQTFWICLEAAVLLWLLRPLKFRWAAPYFLISLPELAVGNIYLLLAGAAVLGMQKPVAWSFPILTKVTVGIGLAWFAVRGEWRRLLQGLGGLALIVGVSYAFEPAAWNAWFRFLLEHREGTPDSQISFYVRCAIAVVLVVVGARKQWPSLIAPAMLLASPVLVGPIPYMMLAAVPRLARLSPCTVMVPGESAADPQSAVQQK